MPTGSVGPAVFKSDGVAGVESDGVAGVEVVVGLLAHLVFPATDPGVEMTPQTAVAVDGVGEPVQRGEAMVPLSVPRTRLHTT